MASQFRLVSDLHMEHADFFIPPMVNDKETYLLLPGDVCLIEKINDEQNHRFFESISNQFKKVFYVPGNHEYYQGDLVTSDAKAISFLKKNEFENIHYMNPSMVDMEDEFVVIGATLWTNFNRKNSLIMQNVQDTLNDYVCIRHNNSRHILADDVYSLHNKHLEYLYRLIQYHKDCGRKIIVMSHHAPSYMSITPEWKMKGGTMNHGFYSHLEDVIKELEPDLWVHGHCHDNLDYYIGSTRILCNPRGYAKVQDEDEFEKWRLNPTILNPAASDFNYLSYEFKSLFNQENKKFDPYLTLKM